MKLHEPISLSTRPIFWQYTEIKELEKMVHPGFSMSMVVIKELIDNACDACEKYGGVVDIKLDKDSFSITNAGVISFETVNLITDFSIFVGEKYKKYGFQRGSIGHGLKIAIMMGISDTNPFIIESSDSKYTIKLKNRKSPNSKDVLEVEHSGSNANNKTTIKFRNKEIGSKEIREYLKKYIAVNPHTHFILNGEEYKPTSHEKKNNKVDMSSYTMSEFEEFISSYKDSQLSDIVGMFNVPESKKKDILERYNKFGERNNDHLFYLIKKASKKLNTPFFGESAIKNRLSSLGIEMFDYKKVRFEKGIAEIALIGGESNIVGVNGSCISDDGFYLQNNITIASNIHYFFPDKSKKWASVYILYSNTKPCFRDINKQIIKHSGENLFSAILKLQKKRETKNEKPARINWLTMSYTKEDLSSVSFESKQYRITKRIFLFMMKARKKAEGMHDLYGPITLRQLYYQLVSDGTIMNSANSYKNFIDHLTKAREKGIIDSDLFEDRSRNEIIPEPESHKEDVNQYVEKIIKGSLRIPEIDIWTGQPYYVELWIEKDALVTLFQKVTEKKQVVLFASRGYTSHTKMNEALKRFKAKIEEGKKGVLLYFGDLDPSGLDIYSNIRNKFEKVKDFYIEIERIALRPEETEGLIPMPLKKSDTRSKKFREFMMEYGLKGSFELDALNPEILMNLARRAIEKYYDKSLLPVEEINEWKEKFDDIRTQILKKLKL